MVNCKLITYAARRAGPGVKRKIAALGDRVGHQGRGIKELVVGGGIIKQSAKRWVTKAPEEHR